jgi:hypothetical protein
MVATEAIEPMGAFPDILPVSHSYALASLGRAAYTLFATPEHIKLHQVVEDACLDGPFQPTHPPIDETVQRIREDVLPQVELVQSLRTDRARLTHLGGILIQFGDYIPKFHDTVSVPYENIIGLHQAVTERAQETGPLDYAEQLDVALKHTNGDMVESLWQLFITSRFYARWLDGKMVEGIPDYSQEEKVALMLEWRGAIAACKEPQPGRAQDPNGDAYYTWTHALAKAAFTLTPEKEGAVTRGAVRVFERGTDLMHKVVHTFNKQGVQSNHNVAAAYGNAIGQTLVDAVR